MPEPIDRLFVRQMHLALDVETQRTKLLKAEKVTDAMLETYEKVVFEYAQVCQQTQQWTDEQHPVKTFFRKLFS